MSVGPLLAEARILPSGLKARQVSPSFPSVPGRCKVAVFLPAATSHNLIVMLFRLPDAKVLPSGLKATVFD
jgi:hypothetical protein